MARIANYTILPTNHYTYLYSLFQVCINLPLLFALASSARREIDSPYFDHTKNIFKATNRIFKGVKIPTPYYRIIASFRQAEESLILQSVKFFHQKVANPNYIA
ncbi:MAG: hypothetical protein Q4D36_00280 [Bacteroidales bacterium]|nr:hypothetical protein [Bacteroidales bacterium]